MKLAFIEILEIEQIPKGINTIMQSITYAPTYNTPPHLSVTPALSHRTAGHFHQGRGA